jgi:hypothetical protein
MLFRRKRDNALDEQFVRSPVLVQIIRVQRESHSFAQDDALALKIFHGAQTI